MYAHELDEWRAAVGDMTESERVASCGHSHRGGSARCADCGDMGEDDMR